MTQGSKVKKAAHNSEQPLYKTKWELFSFSIISRSLAAFHFFLQIS